MIAMQKYTLLILSLLLLSCGFAQQEPMYAQYKTNAFLINPGVAGSADHHQLRINYRTQWSRFPGAPRTISASYHGALDAKNAIGGIFISDQTGPSQRTGIQLAYAFHVPLGISEAYHLSLGLSGKTIRYHFNPDRVFFEDPSDVAIAEAAAGFNVADIAFGAYLYSDDLYLGFSAPNLIQTDLNTLDDGSRSLLSKLYRHYFAIAGYTFRYDQFSVEPSIMVKKVQSAPYQIEGTVRFNFVEDRLFAGISYRTDWLMSFMCGVRARNLFFAYSADFMSPATPTVRVFGNTNELTIGIDLGHIDR
jgi:type IX secretion system PorP/SprF family membrane protein